MPGTVAVKCCPRGPAVTRNGPTPTDVEIPLGERVSLTPGNGEKDLRKRHIVDFEEQNVRAQRTGTEGG